MITDNRVADTFDWVEALPLFELTMRPFRDASDYSEMVRVLHVSKHADGLEESRTVEDLARIYANAKNFDLTQDLHLIEINGRMIAWKNVIWRSRVDGTWIYRHLGHLVPEWRGKGIGRAMLHHSERGLRKIAQRHPTHVPHLFEVFAFDSQPEYEALILSEGYAPVRHEYDMVRPNLDNIPDLPLPEGLNVRPVQPEDWRAIWEANVEAFAEHWGQDTHDEADYQRWLNQPNFDPSLWQVAWDGDQIAGMILNFVDAAQNLKYSRQRGYTEDIAVRKPWRQRGLARALLARSLKMHKELGMKEAALGVDTQNQTGALRLYESMGFQVVRRMSVYQKPF
jgi:ribosomal protein S18 acetylase RimI-like enzyme